MKALPFLCAFAVLLHSQPALADCTLAFAPAQVRHAASQHYYRSPRRDSIPPGHLPPPRSGLPLPSDAGHERNQATQPSHHENAAPFQAQGATAR